MTRLITFLFISIIFGFGIFSCKKDKSIPPDMGYNYFPNQVGNYVVYDVDSFFYNDNFPTYNYGNTFKTARIDTFKFQVKEKIQSIYTDNQNRPTIRLERYRKYYNPASPYSALPWVLSDVWAENKTVTTVEKVEENDRYVRLVFPTKTDQLWDANIQNSYDERKFSYQFVDLARTVGNIQFDSVLQTVYDAGAILTKKEYRTEKYARNVGMIYRQIIDVESQPGGQASFFSFPIMQRITSGYQYTMTVNSYGNE